MNEPNPAWVNAPLEEARWDTIHGHHLAREKSQRIEGNETVIELELTDEIGKVIGSEERRFPRKFIPQDYQSESRIIKPW